jgi:RNA polymerase sigma-70 factor (ECF subfamily)
MAESNPHNLSAVDAVSPTDAELVHAVRAGDSHACFLLWSRYAGLVQRLVCRLLGPGPDYQDVCQEVFLRIFKRIREVAQPEALAGFVTSVALGVARNEARRRRIRAIVGLVPEEQLPHLPVAAASSEAREAVRSLYQLLEGLSAQDRSLFVARFVEKMEMTEVAAAHAMSLSTAKRHVARLMERVNARVQASPVLREYLGHGEPKGAL